MSTARAQSDPTTPAASSSTPSESDIEVAKSHFKTGELNYAAGKFSEAAREFEEAYRLTARPELLYNMGKCYDATGDLRGALFAYRKFLDSVKTWPERAFVERRTAELDKMVSRVQITSSIYGSSVTLDGQRVGTTPLSPNVIEVNPGAHTVEVAAEGFGTYSERMKLSTAQTHRIDAKLVSLVKVVAVERSEHVPVYKRWYLWTPIALVVAGGVVAGTVLGVRAAESINGPSLTLPGGR